MTSYTQRGSSCSSVIRKTGRPRKRRVTAPSTCSEPGASQSTSIPASEASEPITASASFARYVQRNWTSRPPIAALIRRSCSARAVSSSGRSATAARTVRSMCAPWPGGTAQTGPYPHLLIVTQSARNVTYRRRIGLQSRTWTRAWPSPGTPVSGLTPGEAGFSHPTRENDRCSRLRGHVPLGVGAAGLQPAAHAPVEVPEPFAVGGVEEVGLGERLVVAGPAVQGEGLEVHLSRVGDEPVQGSAGQGDPGDELVAAEDAGGDGDGLAHRCGEQRVELLGQAHQCPAESGRADLLILVGPPTALHARVVAGVQRQVVGVGRRGIAVVGLDRRIDRALPAVEGADLVIRAEVQPDVLVEGVLLQS